MDVSTLRNVLGPLIVGLGQSATHKELAHLCNELALPPPPEDGSKRERMEAVAEALVDSEVPVAAKAFLAKRALTAQERNSLQDILWTDRPTLEIPKRCRREVAKAIDAVELYLDGQEFDRLLDSLWILDNSLSLLLGGGQSLRARIERHVHRNPGDWSAEDLFNELGAFDASDQRFARFLEALAGPNVRPEEDSQRKFVNAVNQPLKKIGGELVETASDGGYPVFCLVPLHEGHKARPKNLIFASSVKPDLRFRDAVNNDVDIVTNADKVLIYDRPIGPDGLLWKDLQDWWRDISGAKDDSEAKSKLYRRLQESLPDSSPPQALLFQSFYSCFGSATPTLPALLPEVWLHWDPRTVRERGRDALLRFRMDFLMLLPNGVRVVLEVDGKQHYSNDKGFADPARYARTVAADRDLQLSGYHVFHFGGQELNGEEGALVAKNFFRDLFRRFGLSVPEPK